MKAGGPVPPKAEVVVEGAAPNAGVVVVDALPKDGVLFEGAPPKGFGGAGVPPNAGAPAAGAPLKGVFFAGVKADEVALFPNGCDEGAPPKEGVLVAGAKPGVGLLPNDSDPPLFPNTISFD